MILSMFGSPGATFLVEPDEKGKFAITRDGWKIAEVQPGPDGQFYVRPIGSFRWDEASLRFAADTVKTLNAPTPQPRA